MGAFLLICIFTVSIGVLLGLYGSRRLIVLLVQSVAVTLGVLVLFVAISGDHPKDPSLRYISTAAVYWVFPYIIFFLAPCLFAAVLVRRFKPKGNP